MSSNIAKTLIGVVNDQAFRLGLELKKKYSEEQSQFLSKHSVASVYGFDHWCNMIFYINTSEYPLSHSEFRDVALHPKNMEFDSPAFINFWDKKKERLAKVLHIKPSEIKKTKDDYYTGDELSNYLAKMYGFKSMSELWSNVKFHIEYKDKYYSIFDLKNKELLINIDFQPTDSEFLQPLIINHLSFGQTLAVAPKEWFKYEFDYSSISISEEYQRKGAFYGWTVKRLKNLFLNEIKSKFGNFFTLKSAENLLDIIIPIMMYDNSKNGYPINMHSFCEILKLKSLLLIIGDKYYPKALQFLVKDYIESLGHSFEGRYSTLNMETQRKHDQAAMLISHSVFTLSSLFEGDGFSISNDLRLIDAESIGYLSKHEQKTKGVNLSNDIISELSLMNDKSMVIIFDTKTNPVDENYIVPLREYCKIKKISFVLISDDNSNNFDIKNTTNITKDGDFVNFILTE